MHIHIHFSIGGDTAPSALGEDPQRFAMRLIGFARDNLKQVDVFLIQHRNLGGRPRKGRRAHARDSASFEARRFPDALVEVGLHLGDVVVGRLCVPAT